MTLSASLVVALCPLPCSEGVAQSRGSKQPSTVAGPAASVRVWAGRSEAGRLVLGVDERTVRARSSFRSPPRDSLLNGTIIGAIVGAAALGTVAAVICRAQQEPEGPSCVSDALRIAGVGAAIGAGGGLIIDAARARRGGVRLSITARF